MDDKTKEKIEGLTKALRGLAKPMFDAFIFVLPRAINVVQIGYAYWMKLPQNAILFTYGSVFCFFGGTFPVLFAAIQAAEYSGRKAVVESLQALADEALIIIEESKKDDAKDDDGDGIPDVKQISQSELLQRKTLLVLRKMNPDKIDKALAALYKVWMGVVAVLAVKFAKTVSMALAIADFLHKPCDRFITPVLQRLIPDEYDKWVPITLSWITKSIAMSLAWYIQSVISATASSLKGGLMMSQAVFQFMVVRKISFFGLIPDDHDKSSVDEVMSYVFAGCGFYTQFRLNFSLPSPLNLILFPVSMAEQYIRYAVTYGN
ncbi:hypothetical protein ACA910_018271 [Epithemia clementina (nom. ined.)]